MADEGVAKEEYHKWSALQRELMRMTNQQSGPRNEWVQNKVLCPSFSMEQAHPFYPRYKDTLVGLPPHVNWPLLCLFEANGSFEALDIFMTENNHLKDVKWTQFPEEQLERMFMHWLSKVPLANVTNIPHMVGQPNLWTQTCHVAQLHLCQDGKKEEVSRAYNENIQAGYALFCIDHRIHPS